VDALELAVTVFEIWKPTIESSVETIKTDVQKLSNHWNRAVKDKVTTDQGMYPPPGTTPSVRYYSTGGDYYSVWVGVTAPVGPEGHRVNKQFRDLGYGSILTYTQIPGKGTCEVPLPPPNPHPPPPLPRYNSNHSY
jgi:hypothetical protein